MTAQGLITDELARKLAYLNAAHGRADDGSPIGVFAKSGEINAVLVGHVAGALDGRFRTRLPHDLFGLRLPSWGARSG